MQKLIKIYLLMDSLESKKLGEIGFNLYSQIVSLILNEKLSNKKKLDLLRNYALDYSSSYVEITTAHLI